MKTVSLLILLCLLTGVQSEGECTKASGCPDDTMCCSQWGYCGIGPDYCGAGCLCGPDCGSGLCGNLAGNSAPGSCFDGKLPQCGVYLVAAGDYLSMIASNRNTNVTEIQRVNMLGTSTTIYPGQLLLIPPCQCTAQAMALMSDSLACAGAVSTLIGAVASLAGGFSGVIGAVSGAIQFAGQLEDGACSVSQGLTQDEIAIAKVSTLESKLKDVILNTVFQEVDSAKTSLGSVFDPTSYRYALTVKGDKQGAIEILKELHRKLDPLMATLYYNLDEKEFASASGHYLYLASTHVAVWQELINLQLCNDGWLYYLDLISGKYAGRGVAAERIQSAWSLTSPDSGEQMAKYYGFSDSTQDAFAKFNLFTAPTDKGWSDTCV